MEIFKKMAVVLWRIWFYILLGLPIILMLPFLILFTSSERFYSQYFVCSRIWALCILYGMGFFPRVKSSAKLEKGKSYMFVANHNSIIDIMLMLASVKHPFVFLGKVELARIPLFGHFYRRTCILVDRSSQKSKQEAFNKAQRRLDQGNSICIFPEGGVNTASGLLLDPFKDGAFRLAIDHQTPIVPLTFHDTRKRFSYSFFTGSPGKLRVKIHPLIETKNRCQQERRQLKDEVFNTILGELHHPSVF